MNTFREIKPCVTRLCIVKKLSLVSKNNTFVLHCCQIKKSPFKKKHDILWGKLQLPVTGRLKRSLLEALPQ